MNRHHRVAALVLPCVLAGACATTPKKGSAPMEKMKVVGETKPDGQVTARAYDAATLFERGLAAQQEDRLDAAVEAYHAIIAEFSESIYVVPTRYNLGMALEQLGRHEEAAAQYQALITAAPGSADARDAAFRLAVCQRVLGRYAEAERTLRVLLTDRGARPLERYLARIRLGEVLIALLRLDDAEHELRSLLTRARPRPNRTEPLLTGPMLAEAQYTLARVYRTRFDALPIRLPLEQMGKDVAAKVEVFKRAQSAYLRAVRIGVAATTTASGMELGQMYEDFCRDFVEAPIPPDLAQEEIDVYYELLLKEVRPLLGQAIYVYEKSLGVAERLGAANDFVESSRGRLEALKKALSEEQGLDDLREFLGVPPPAAPAKGAPPVPEAAPPAPEAAPPTS